MDITTQCELGPNENGEMWVKNSTLMKGYLGNPKATAETITADGWLRTGEQELILFQNHLEDPESFALICEEQ